MLLTAGEKPFIQDKDGKSPLYHTAKADYMCIREILLKYGGRSGSSVERNTHSRYDEVSGTRDGPKSLELDLAFCDAAADGDADVVQQVLK